MSEVVVWCNVRREREQSETLMKGRYEIRSVN